MKQDKNRPVNGEETVAGSVDNRTEKKTDRKKINWKQVMLYGVPGVLIGATPVLLSNAVSASEIEESLPETEGNAGEGEYRLDSVNDEMSFGEAFAAARAELGAGGVFEWRGNLYGTYTADEWNELHPEDAVGSDDADVADAAQTVTEEPAEEEPAAAEEPAAGEELASEQEPTPETGEPAVESEEEIDMADETADYADAAEPAGAGDNEVVILGVSNVEMEDGSEVVVGGMSVDGNEVMVIDVDNDGVFDGMIADVNGDGAIDTDEIVDIQAGGLTVEQFAEVAEAESTPDVADEGGYTNEIG